MASGTRRFLDWLDLVQAILSATFNEVPASSGFCSLQARPSIADRSGDPPRNQSDFSGVPPD